MLSSFLPDVLLLSIILSIIVYSSASKKRMKGTSTISLMTFYQPSKLSKFLGNPSIKNFFSAHPFFSIPFFKSWHVISTGTIFPSTMHALIIPAVSDPLSLYLD
jgi:hypothetical protein